MTTGKQMRFWSFFSLFLLMLPFSTKAQDGDIREQLEELRTQIYTRTLNLSADESKKFWPIFNQMSDELEVVRKRERRIKKEINRNSSSLTEAEMDAKLQQLFSLGQQRVDISKKYYPQLKTAVSVHKVALMYKAERNFKQELIKRLNRAELDDD